MAAARDDRSPHPGRPGAGRMTNDAEATIRAAVDALAAAILAAVRADAAPTDGPDRLLDIDAAAEALSLGRSLLYAEIAAGRLRSVKVGRRRLIPQGALTAYIAERSA